MMAASSSAAVKPLPDGLYPTMITPFLNDEKKSVDWNGLDSEEIRLLRIVSLLHLCKIVLQKFSTGVMF